MREPKPGDFVIHFNDGVIVGWSRVAEAVQELTGGPPNPAQWAGRPSYYRVALKDYQDFTRTVPLSEFIVRHHDTLAEEIRIDSPKRFPFIIYKDTIRRAQGAYLTRCTPRLYDIIRNEVYLDGELEPFGSASHTWRRRPNVEERIRRKLELAIPSDEVRRAALEVLGSAIEAADEDRGDAWYLRETEHGLRLIAASLVACELRRSRLRVSVIGPVLDDVLGTLGAELEDEFKWVAGGVIVGMPVEKAETALSLLRDANDAFIDSAMSRVRRPGSLENHVPEAVGYLSTIIGRDLPQPQPASELPSPDADSDAEEEDVPGTQNSWAGSDF